MVYDIALTIAFIILLIYSIRQRRRFLQLMRVNKDFVVYNEELIERLDQLRHSLGDLLIDYDKIYLKKEDFEKHLNKAGYEIFKKNNETPKETSY